VAVRRGFLVERAGGNLQRQVAVKYLFDVLTDAQGIEQLQVRETFEENDTHDQLVSVLHFFDRFLTPLLGQILVTPIVEQPAVQPILVDRGQFMPQRLI